MCIVQMDMVDAVSNIVLGIHPNKGEQLRHPLSIC